MENNKSQNIKLAILNITSWAGQCSGATHLYGHLVLCDKDVSIEILHHCKEIFRLKKCKKRFLKIFKNFNAA